MTVVYWAELQGAGRRLGRLAERGAFNTGVHYVPGDIVTHSGVTYVALAERAPGGPTPGTDGGAGTWGALTDVFGNVPQPPTPALPHLPAGVPRLQGPYIVDYTDIPHDGDTKVLWTPQVGDVLLRVFPDFRTVVQWTHGQLWLAQGLPDNENNFLAGGQPGYIANADNPSNLDTERALISGGAMIDGADLGAPYMCRNTQPITVLFRNASPFGDGIEPTQGHVELYALIARALAP